MGEEMLYESYKADEYFGTSYREGVYDDRNQWWLIYPEGKAYEREDFLVIGSPGVDQIEWGYRKVEPGIWLYDPGIGEFRYLALTLTQLINGWHSGKVVV